MIKLQSNFLYPHRYQKGNPYYPPVMNYLFATVCQLYNKTKWTPQFRWVDGGDPESVLRFMTGKLYD